MANVQKPVPPSAKKQVQEVERKKDTSMALVFFLAIVVIAAIACVVYEHTEYKVVKSHDDTTSADVLNGQTPANTEPGGAAASATAAGTTIPSGAKDNSNASSPATTAPQNAASSSGSIPAQATGTTPAQGSSSATSQPVTNTPPAAAASQPSAHAATGNAPSQSTPAPASQNSESNSSAPASGGSPNR